MDGQLTLDQALQNIDNTLRQVQTNLDTHAALQGSLQLIRQELVQRLESIDKLMTEKLELFEANQDLREQLAAIYKDDTGKQSLIDEPQLSHSKSQNVENTRQ